MTTVVLSPFVFAGCAPPSPAAPPLAVAVADAIRGFSSAHSVIHSINEVARNKRSTPAQVAGFFTDPNPNVKFAAVYLAALWADGADDVEVLKPLLNDSDEAIRAMTAGSLAGLGDRDATRTLSALTASAALMPFSDPPLMVSEFVRPRLASASLKPRLLATPQLAGSSGAGEGGFSLWKAANAVLETLVPTLEATSSLETTDTAITLKVPIVVQGGTESMMLLWQAGIEDAWNHGNNGDAFEICGRKVTFQPELSLAAPDGTIDPSSHLIVVEQVRDGQYYVSTVWHQPGTQPTDSSRTAFWASNAPPSTAAHEFGHFLGLDDEYRENDVNGNGERDPGETVTPDTAAFPDAAQSLMANGAGAVLQRHVDAAVKGHDVGDTIVCMQEVLIRGVYTSQPQNVPNCNGTRATIEIRLNVAPDLLRVDGTGTSRVIWRNLNPCSGTLFGGVRTAAGSANTVMVAGLHDYASGTRVTIATDELTESYLITGDLIGSGPKPFLPFWMGLIKATSDNATGTLASFVVKFGEWKEGSTFLFENRTGEGGPSLTVKNYGSATLEICRQTSAGPFRGCTAQ